MTDRDIRNSLQDILTTIEMAEQFVAGMTFEQFQDDPKTIFAVTRALEVIGEATKQSLSSLDSRTTQLRNQP
ncbi:HepT-like ribonuclease domain-containing protein [Egbenema bharatensis]|uniref:HepT-like ribonuclease domain-containing protein n=1 Tax=Egbenema bharatensis TaxID=3463334 RepID=UPI003A85F9CF